MARSTQELLVVIDASTEQLRRQLKRADDSVARSTGKIDRSIKKVDQTFNRLGAAAQAASRAMSVAVAAVAGSAVLHKLTSTADMYTQIHGRLQLVTDSSSELAEVQQKLFASAQDTSTAFEDVVGLYSRLAISTADLGLSQEKLLTLTELINQSYVISGASASEAANGTQQLAQALASGVLRGDEFNSVMENSPRLARALAEALGVTVGELRKMAEAGELTAGRVLPALLSQASQLDTEFGSMGDTIERAMTRLTNAVNAAMGKADMSPLIDAIDRLTEVVSDPDVQKGIGELATTAVKFVSDMTEGLSALGRAISDLRDLDFAGASKALGKQLLDNSGPGFLYEMITGQKWSERLGNVLSGQASPAPTKLAPVSVTAAKPKSAPVNLPNIPAIPPDFFKVDADDLVQSMERELAKVDELLLEDFGKKGKAVDLSNVITFELPEQGSESIEELERQLDDVGESTLQLQLMALQVGNSFADAFTDAIFEAKNLGDAMQGLAEDISRTIVKALILKSIQTGINHYFDDSKTPNAKGNVFDQSGLVPFAKGGIVNSPVVFPFANGTGLMGEAGPEAIMPLSRGRGGKLGVQASGGGVVVNINNHTQAQVTAKSRRGQDGQQVLDLMVEDSFNRLLGNGRLDQSLAANMGARRPGRF